MLGPTYLDFTRYFYCTCLTRPRIFCLDLETWEALRKESKSIKLKAKQVGPVEEAVHGVQASGASIL